MDGAFANMILYLQATVEEQTGTGEFLRPATVLAPYGEQPTGCMNMRARERERRLTDAVYRCLSAERVRQSYEYHSVVQKDDVHG